MKRTRLTHKLACGLVAGSSLVAVLLAASPARSDPRAPPRVQSDFNLPCTPDCTLCHQNNNGGIGNRRNAVDAKGQVVDPINGGFIYDLLVCGFLPTDPNTYEPAFAKCESTKADADRDGVPDIDELTAGTDPNDGTPGKKICNESPTYGCVRVARGGPVDDVALFSSTAVLLIGIGLVRRRSAR